MLCQIDFLKPSAFLLAAFFNSSFSSIFFQFYTCLLSAFKDSLKKKLKVLSKGTCAFLNFKVVIKCFCLLCMTCISRFLYEIIRRALALLKEKVLVNYYEYFKMKCERYIVDSAYLELKISTNYFRTS